MMQLPVAATKRQVWSPRDPQFRAGYWKSREPERANEVPIGMKKPSLQTESLEAPSSQLTSVAKILAPEDIRRGDYVTVLAELGEYPSFFWCNGIGAGPADEPVRIWWRSRPNHDVFKVVSICLPLLLLKSIDGSFSQIDIRQSQLAKLSRGYARLVWKRTGSRKGD